ncbi:MAG TPA: magnesium/cobalt transporter CorA [Chloroflexota bacterium]|nr:magnesium/cobalt transporter CorA [Chloroflexota bacterium]
MIKVLANIGAHSPEFAEPADLPRLMAAPNGLTWVDIESPDEAEASLLADVFHFHPLTIEDCLNDEVDPPKVDDYDSYLFAIIQAIDFSASEETLVTTELNLYLGPNYLVTVHKRPLPALGQVLTNCQRNHPMTTRGADWLMHSVLDELVDQLLPVLEAMDEDMSGLEDRALVKPTRELVERMSQLKRSTLRLRWLVAPQREVMNRLARGDFGRLIRAETYPYYRDVYDHLVRMDSMVEDLRDMGESVLAVHLATQNNRLNEVMKALGIVGVIFLPLTLISGVFGTNFDSTYMDSQWLGFGLMCGSFVAIAAFMLAWFKKRGWF